MSTPARDSARILVVDDDPGMVRAVTRILERHHEVVGVSGADEALEAAEALDPDVAVLDVRMPDVDGFELMQRLLADRPDLDVILMTGSMGEPDAHLVRAIDAGAFYFIRKPFNRRVLITLVARCVELRRLQQAQRRHALRMERELTDARRFQQSLLPPAEGAIGSVSVCARYLACTELAGDFYDYAPAGDGRLAVVVADVSGHGAPAAMMTGLVKSAFRAAHADDYDPAVVIDRVADAVRTFEPSRFVTLFCGRIEGGAGTFRYASAGHPAALVRRSGGTCDRLESTGPLVSSGVPCAGWEVATTAIAPADRLLLYTDGLLEARGFDGLFGAGRLEAALSRSPHRGPALLDDLLAALAAHTGRRPADDDITLLTADLDGVTR